MKSLVFALTLAALIPTAFAETGVVFESSFEAPEIVGRISKDKGGDIANHGDRPEWLFFDDTEATPTSQKPDKAGKLPESKGAVVAGLSNELARTGKQSVFIQADKSTQPQAGAAFSSAPIPIVPGTDYLVSIWGRNDKHNPLVLKTPQMILRLQIDFFSDNGDTQTGDSEFLVQPLPDSPKNTPAIVNSQRKRIVRSVTAPDDAKTMVVTWRCNTGPEKGSVSGVVYLDDVAVEGEIPAKPTEGEKPADSAAGTPAGASTETKAPEAPKADKTPAPAEESKAPAATPSPEAKARD